MSAGLASALTRAWVRLYTLGLPAPARRERRDEIASDLWEHATESRIDGHGAGPEILERCLLGIPSDLLWRVQRSRLARTPGLLVRVVFSALAAGEAVARWLGRRGLPGLAGTSAILLGLLGGLVGLSAWLNDNTSAQPGQLAAVATFLVLAAVLVGGGSRVLDTRPRLGSALVVVGAAPAGLLLWQTLLAPVLAAGLCWGCVRRWRARSGPRTRAA